MAEPRDAPPSGDEVATAIDALRRYVEGASSPVELLGTLHANGPLEHVLSKHPPPAFDKVHVNAFDYLLEVDPANPFSVADSRRHLQQVLGGLGVPTVTDDGLASWERLRRLQPKWVDLPTEMLRALLAEAGTRKGKALAAFVADWIRARFRYLKAPPRWLQSPAWPLDAVGEPLVFVGQLDLGSLRHDDAAVYVFLDPRTGTVASVLQSA